jgi:hypothetical protein
MPTRDQINEAQREEQRRREAAQDRQARDSSFPKDKRDAEKAQEEKTNADG